MALVYRMSGDYGHATPLVKQSLSIARELKDAKLTALATECGKSREIAAQLAEEKYEDAAETVEQALGPTIFSRRVANTFGERRSNACELKGAVLALPKLAKGAVVTTNFDRILERTFAEAGSPFEQVVWGSQVDSMRRAIAENKPFLLKVHGDAEERSGRVLTKSEYEANYAPGDPDSLRAQLGRLFQGRTLLFVGCNLGKDRTMEVLLDVLMRSSGVEHFAILDRPVSDDELFEKQRRLGERGILPIWYPHGRHDLIEPLLRWIAKSESMQILLDQTEEFLAAVRYFRKKDLIDQEIALKNQDEAMNRYWLAKLGRKL